MGTVLRGTGTVLGGLPQPLLCTDDGERADPAGAPGPRDRSCPPGELGTGCLCWSLQPGLLSPTSPLSPPPDAQQVQLRLPRAPRPSWSKGAVCVRPREEAQGPPGTNPLALLALQNLFCFGFGLWLRGLGWEASKWKRWKSGAGSQALSFPNRERKATEGSRGRGASPDFLGRKGRLAAQGSRVTRVPGAPQVLQDLRGPQDHPAPGEAGAHPWPLPFPGDQRTR